MVGVVAVVVRVIALRVVLVHLLVLRLVDTTVVVGHRGVGPVDFLETAGVFISRQHTVLSSTFNKNNLSRYLQSYKICYEFTGKSIERSLAGT